ncbi:MAG: hypothetical protein ACHQQQ_04580 [Bacteroidota bacterium]
MIGQTISHYKILEKPRHKDGGQVGEGEISQNHPRAFFASGCDFADLPLFGFRFDNGIPKSGTVERSENGSPL